MFRCELLLYASTSWQYVNLKFREFNLKILYTATIFYEILVVQKVDFYEVCKW